MLRKFLFISLLALLFGTGLKAQRWNFSGGFVYEFIVLKENNPFGGQPSSALLPFYGLSLSGAYTLVHSKDVVSLCADPGLRFGFSFSSAYGTRVLGQFPLTLMGRLGAGATPFNEQKVGIGLGIGGNYTYVYSSELGNPLKQGFITPNAVGELNIRTGRSIYQIRFHWSLASATHTYSGLNVDFSNIGLEVVSTF